MEESGEVVMRDVILLGSMSLDGFVGGHREHAGIAIPEGVDWSSGSSTASARLVPT